VIIVSTGDSIQLRNLRAERPRLKAEVEGNREKLKD
jgi:hypothetical protein